MIFIRTLFIKIDYTKEKPIQVETFLTDCVEVTYYSRLFFQELRDIDIYDRMNAADETVVFVESKFIKVVNMFLETGFEGNAFIVLPLSRYKEYLDYHMKEVRRV